MWINSSQINDIRKSFKVYNLYPYIVNTIDVYFITSDPDLQKDILTPDSDGNPRLYLNIDGFRFPLQYGLCGDSPTNPIQYTKTIEKAKFSITERNSLTNRKVTGFVGSDKISGWTTGININDVDDFIEIKLEVKSIPTQVSTRYGYGSSQSLISIGNRYGKYGYGSLPDSNGNIISYGGYGNDFIFKDAAIILEASKRKTYDYVHNYSSDTHADSEIHGYGEGIYGGDTGDGFGE